MSIPLRVAVTATAVAALGLVGASCGGEDDETTPPQPTTFAVYLLQGEQVAPVRRRVEATNGVARAALMALLAGATEEEAAAGYGSTIPPETELRDVSIADGTATVDLSSRFAAGGGSLSMLTRVAQVVYTATQFTGVERVAFRLDGEPAEAIGGKGAVVDPPVSRADFEDQTPAILIESPLPGDTVGSPVRLRGTANVFEANIGLEVQAVDGTVLKRTFMTATSGTGTRGTFDDDVTVDAAEGPFVIFAFAPSGEDGSPLFPVELPLTLER